MSSTFHDVRSLADAQFDGTIDGPGVELLEHLIDQDPQCLQIYLDTIQFHGALLMEMSTQSDEQVIRTAIREYSINRQQSSGWLVRFPKLIAAATALCLILGLLVTRHLMRPGTFGVVASMAVQTQTAGEQWKLGDLLRIGQELKVVEGMLTIDLDHVQLDLVAPCTVLLEDRQRVRLLHGGLAVSVQPGGEGFAVRTTDAEVIDLGTEFSIEYDRSTGTNLTVTRGRVDVQLLNSSGQPTRSIELTAHRSAHLVASRNQLDEVPYRPDLHTLVEKTRGGIRRVTGQLQLPYAPQRLLLQEGQQITNNFMLVVPERQHVTLAEDLVVNSLQGEVVIPAGTEVSSYLIHYNPTDISQFAPRGSVTFFGRIAAAVVHAESLDSTDSLFGLSDASYSNHSARGLEHEFDQLQISEDGMTASFFFGMAPPDYLDEVRLLVAPGL